jgi:hypothetical protein
MGFDISLREEKGTTEKYRKEEKEEMRNPPKIKGDSEGKYLSL